MPMGGVSASTNYKKERLEEQILWHSKKARQNKLKLRLYQLIILIAVAIIPIINMAGIGDETRIISSTSKRSESCISYPIFLCNNFRLETF